MIKIILLGIILLFIIFLISYMFVDKKTILKIKPDIKNYGSKERLSDTVSKLEAPKTKSITTKFSDSNSLNLLPLELDEYLNQDENDKSQKAIKEIKENIRKVTGQDFYSCGKRSFMDSPTGANIGDYPILYYITIGTGIQSLLNRDPLPLYDIGSIIFPVTNFWFYTPNEFRNMKITYENDDKTIKSVRVMKMKFNKNPDNSITQYDSDEPLTVAEFVNKSINNSGFYPMPDLINIPKPDKDGNFIDIVDLSKIDPIKNGVWGWLSSMYPKKSKFFNDIVEKILKPFSENLFDGKLFDNGYDIDILTFAKCLIALNLRQINIAMYLYENNCCQNDFIKDKCDAAKKVMDR